MALFAIPLAAYQTKPAGDKNEKANNASSFSNKENNKEQSTLPAIPQQAVDSKPTEHTSQNKTKSSPNDSPDWTNRVNAASTLIIALFTILLFCGLVVQIRTTRAIERAWITVGVDKLPDFPNDPNAVAILWIKPTVKNSGRTPARITKMVLRSHEVDPSNEIIPGILPPDPAFPSDKTTLVEGRDIVLPPNDGGQPLGIAITPERFNDARIGKKTLYIYGYVEYRDTVANKPHETHFCYIYWPQRGFSPDPSGFYIAGVTPKKYIGAT